MKHLSVKAYATLVRVVLPLLVIVAIMVNGASEARALQEIIDLGTVRPSVPKVYIIAIPGFDAEQGSKVLSPGSFYNIIYRDLELSGHFNKVKQQEFVEQNHRRDNLSGQIDAKEWARLGADFVLKGSYTWKGEVLEAQCILYYGASGKRVFGRRIAGFKSNQLPTLAHKISDLVMKYVTGIDGIATTKIVFVSTRTGHQEVFCMDADGANQRQLTSDKSICVAPCWGMNATEIYFTSYKNYNPDLYGVFLTGSQPWLISGRPGLNVSAHWSPKARQIALTLSKDGNSELYLVSREGRNFRRLTRDRAIESSPSWSPDGKQIVFSSNRSGSIQLYVMDMNGQNTKRVTRQGRYNEGGVWSSPKGNKIAFAGKHGGVFDIFVMNSDGSEWVQLTANQGNNEEPTWGPNGEHLAFVSDRTGKAQIYRMNIYTANQVRLTSKGANKSPAWSPFIYPP